MSARAQIESALVKGRAEKYALILFDLDLFKNANDRYGHMFGDEVLKDVARRIVQNIRQEDIAARIGGDEFLIFTPYKDEVEPMVSRLFEAIAGRYAQFDVSLSMGGSIAPKDGKNYELLFHRADQALYAAKQHGRKRYCFYDDSVRGTLSVLSPMESDLAGPDPI